MTLTQNFGEEIGMKRKTVNLVLDILLLRCLDHTGGATTGDQIFECERNLAKGYRFAAHKTLGAVEKKSELNFGHNEFRDPLECGNASLKIPK